jgi:hypothetical protein
MSPYPAPSQWSYARLQDLVGGADARAGADLLLANVISFDVKVLDPIPPNSTNNYTGYNTIVFPQPVGAQNPFSLQAGLLGPNNAANPNRFVDIGFGRNYTDGKNDIIGNNGPFVGPGNLSSGFLGAPNTGGGYIFDTWSTRNNGSWNYNAVPGPYLYPFTAIQIKIRAWDRKTNQTRELTIIQDM